MDGRTGSAAQAAGLFALESRRMLRGWRWRTLVLLNAAVAAVLSRTGDWGEGAAVFLPGGETGVRAFGLMYAIASMVLATDLAGQADRHHARSLYDARPVSGFALQCSRFLAMFATIAPLAVATSLLPPAIVRARGGDALLAPNALYLCGHVLPLVALCVAAGLAARSWIRNDTSALSAASVALAAPVWVALFDSQPQELFLSSSRILGVLVPASETARTASLSCLAVLPFLGLAMLKPRALRSRTPLRSLSPPRKSRFGTVRGAFSAIPGARETGAFTLLLALAAVCAGGPALLGSFRRAGVALTSPVPTEMSADWSRMQQPAEAVSGVVDAPRIVARKAELDTDGEDRIAVTLTLGSSLDAPQPVAGVTFGPACRVASVSRGDGRVEILPAAASPHLHATVLRFDPPLPPNGECDLRFELEPAPRSTRAWARLRHPAYATFQDLPLWYGEGVRIRYAFSEFAVTHQPAPFELSLPLLAGREWIAGAAESRIAGETVSLVADRAAVPSSVFAANVRTVASPEEQAVPVHYVVFPEHEELARAFHTIFADRFERLGRAFGGRDEPVVFVEVPGQRPGDPFAIASPVLDELATLLPDYDDPREPTADEFERPFAELHHAAVSTLVTQSRETFEHPELLRDSLVLYLHVHGFARGMTRPFRRERRDYVLVPWDWVRPTDAYPFDLWPRDEAQYTGPVFPQLRPEGLPPVPQGRLVAFHHMLRRRLGEEAYVRFLNDLFGERGGRLTLEEVRLAAEAQAGAPLGEFFDQWLLEGVVPRYRLVEAQVVLAENPETRDLEYTTSVTVRNEGTGRVPVDVRLETEGDRVEKTVEPDPGGDVTLVFVTADRPVSVAVDPEGWVVQMPEFDRRAGRPVHPRLFLKTVREL